MKFLSRFFISCIFLLNAVLNYTKYLLKLTTKLKSHLVFQQSGVCTIGGSAICLTVPTSNILELQINPGFYIKTGNFNYETG